MPAGSPHSRFALRASALLIAMLLIWWFVLRHPMLAVLRGSVETVGVLVFGGGSTHLITENNSGDWSLRVPLEAVVPDSPQHPGGALVHSVDLDIARSDLTAFTFSLPVYWAIILAAPGLRRSVRPLLLGTMLIAVLEVLLLLVFVEIAAHNLAAQLSPAQNSLSGWLRHFGEYMIVTVIPYAAPFVMALTLHRELKRQIFGWGGDGGAGDSPAQASRSA